MLRMYSIIFLLLHLTFGSANAVNVLHNLSFAASYTLVVLKAVNVLHNLSFAASYLW